MTPNPTPSRAKSCPMCGPCEEFLNVTPIYTWERFKVHAANLHPGMDAWNLWKFPAPWKRANG
jgi:hypothetical protein